MKIDNNVQVAMHDASIHFHGLGGFSHMERLSGVNQSLMIRWSKGKTKTASNENWEKVYPHVFQFLPDDPEYWPKSKATAYANATINSRHPCEGKNRPQSIKRLCERWDDLTDKDRDTVLGVIDMVLDKLPELGKAAGM